MSTLILPSTLTTKPTIQWDTEELRTFRLENNQIQYSLNDDTINTLEGINGNTFVQLDTAMITILDLGPIQPLNVLVLVKDLMTTTSGSNTHSVLTMQIR